MSRPSATEVIVPRAELLMLPFGKAKFMRLVVLKNSA